LKTFRIPQPLVPVLLKIFRITETGGWSPIIFSKSKEPQFWDFENFQGSSSSHERISREPAV
jgi:hypothetical protein